MKKLQQQLSSNVSDQELRIPDSCCCGYEESDPTTAATGRGLVERELSIKKLVRFSSDPHWIGGGFFAASSSDEESAPLYLTHQLGTSYFPPAAADSAVAVSIS